MQSDNRDNLIKLAQFIKELLQDKNNEWFRIHLLEKVLDISKIEQYTENIQLNELINDIRRTKFYLKRIDRQFNLEAFKFYKQVADPTIKSKLMGEFKGMKIALFENDILEYCRKMIIQLEYSFDQVIMITNGWEVIKSSPDMYKEVSVKLGNFDFKKEIAKNFFWDAGLYNQVKGLSDIDFFCKFFYCSIFCQIDYTKHTQNLKNIYLLRNVASHGAIMPKDKEKVDKLVKSFDDNSYYYNKTFLAIISALNCLYKAGVE